MNTHHLRGTWTALITPFQDDESIDYSAVKNLVENQIAAGVTGILLIGTTGESPTLTDDECVALIHFVKNQAADRCLVMAGCGTNSTAKSIHKAKAAAE